MIPGRARGLLCAGLLLFLACLGACTTVHRTAMASHDVAGAQGEVLAVVDVTSTGVGLMFNKVTLVEGGNVDQVVNRTLVAEAKAAGGSRVQVVTLVATSQGGLNLYQFPWLVTFPTVVATAYVLK